MNTPTDPLFGYDKKAMAAHVESNLLKPGDQLMVYGSHGGMNHYRLVTVEEANVGRQKRIIVSHPGESGGRSFYRNGTNCYVPKGQTRLIPVIDWVLERMGNYQMISFSLDWEIALPALPQKEETHG